MITQLTGKVIDQNGNIVTIDIGGVGYAVTLTNRGLSGISHDGTMTLFIAENIKEDHYELYGFTEKNDRDMYTRLNAVTGVGPKATMAILSAHSTGEIEEAILAANTTVFSNVSGIGKKTASRIILELKGKLDVTHAANVKDDPAYLALIALGYSVRQAEVAAANIPTDIKGVDARVKAALQGISK